MSANCFSFELLPGFCPWNPLGNFRPPVLLGNSPQMKIQFWVTLYRLKVDWMGYSTFLSQTMYAYISAALGVLRKLTEVTKCQKDALRAFKVIRGHPMERTYTTTTSYWGRIVTLAVCFPSYGDVKVENRLLGTPLSHLTPSLAVIP